MVVYETDRTTSKVVRSIGFGANGFAEAERAEYECFGVVNDYLSDEDVAAGVVTAYAAQRHSSRFFILESEDAVIGTCRLLNYDPSLGWASFTTPRDFGHWPVGPTGRSYFDPAFSAQMEQGDPATFAELATLALMPGHRGLTNMLHLLGAVYERTHADGIEFWTMALVKSVLRMLQRQFPGAISIVGSMIPDYIGADSWPCTFELNHPAVERMHKDHRCKYKLIPRSSGDTYDIQPLLDPVGQSRVGDVVAGDLRIV